MATENDIVLVYYEDNPLTYARIESIEPDHKPDWYHVTLLMLQVPSHVVTWILRTAYINGDEFTMNGKKMRLELLEPVGAYDDDLDVTGQEDESLPAGPGDTKVISFADRNKNKP